MVFTWSSDATGISNDWVLLNSGQVQINEIEDDQKVPGVRAAFIVNASRDKIWSILVDYDNFKTYFSNIEKIEVISIEKDSAIIDFTLDGVFKDVQYVLKRSYIETGHILQWVRHSGDMDIIHGSWKIDDIDGSEKKLVIYESYVDFGNSFITWVISQFAIDKAHDMAIRLRSWMEKEF